MRRENPSAVVLLARYGLDRVVTGEDDPALWAAALLAHWPAPEDPELNVPGLSFGIRGSLDPVWRFERVGAGELKPVAVEWPPARATPSEILAVAPRPRHPHLDLQVQRPSAGLEEAVVEAGAMRGVLAGRGEARVWRRVPRGEVGPFGWEETSEVVSVWLS